MPAKIAILAGTIIQSMGQFDGIATIGTAFGGIPNKLPTFQLPNITTSRIIELIGPSFTIALLGAIESLLSAVIADEMANTKHNANQELIGQGIANILTPLFSGFAATGAIARTATNVKNGGTSDVLLKSVYQSQISGAGNTMKMKVGNVDSQ